MADNVIELKEAQKKKAAKKPLSVKAQREKIVQEELAPLIEDYHLLRLNDHESELYQHFVKHQERAFLQRILNIAEKNISEAARILELDRFTVQQKLKGHGLI